MRRPPRLLTLGLAAATVAALAGCKEHEQNRILYHKEGVYQGEADTPLKDDTVDQLRQRALRQAG
jgi:outer membrane protein assembly factor BamE (lipoprotein component of BamABCDE complex)